MTLVRNSLGKGAVLAMVGLYLALTAVPLRADLISPVSPSDPTPIVEWPNLLPPLPTPYEDPTETDCIHGQPSCIDRTINTMQHRLGKLVQTCDHRAVFALAYLRVTEDARNADRSGLFSDSKWFQNEDRVFARYYFSTFDAYAGGRLTDVPVAWRIAFDAAVNKQVPALGNLVLSMNAHINRDFPYMLAGVGLTKPDGSSRKPDHDAYNARLAALYQPMLAEIAARFDPTADDYDASLIDNVSAVLTLQAGRESVWRNAERLANASSDAERRLVAASIEAEAATAGQTLFEAFRYRLGQSSAERDAWCAAYGAGG